MKFFFLILLATILSAPQIFAGSRRFSYVYEVTTSPPGDIEIENWVTWQAHRPNDHNFREVDFRHELEFGITEKLQMAIYVADWNYQCGFSYTGSALEMIYNFTNPVADPLGFSIYEEIQIGNRRVETESKLLAQKNFGRWVAAYNLTLEAEWEGQDLTERNGEAQQSLGVSYEITPRLLLGAEFLHEVAFPDWSKAERGKIFAGPNVSLRSGKYWATVTALAQLTRAGDEPDFQLRTIFGFSF